MNEGLIKLVQRNPILQNEAGKKNIIGAFIKVHNHPEIASDEQSFALDHRMPLLSGNKINPKNMFVIVCDGL